LGFAVEGGCALEGGPVRTKEVVRCAFCHKYPRHSRNFIYFYLEQEEKPYVDQLVKIKKKENISEKPSL